MDQRQQDDEDKIRWGERQRTTPSYLKDFEHYQVSPPPSSNQAHSHAAKPWLKNSPAHPPYMTKLSKLKIRPCSFSAGRMHSRGSKAHTDPITQAIPVVSLTLNFHWIRVSCVMAPLWFCCTPRQSPPVAFWVRHSAVWQTAGVARPRSSQDNRMITHDHSYRSVL